MEKVRLYLTAALLVLVACNYQKSKKEEDHDKSQMTKIENEIEEDHKTVSTIQLDNGKKWKANAETITGISNMTSIVDRGIAEKIDASKLDDSLQVEFKTIFDKCTMTGESHNQLHNFLIPLKGKLNILQGGNKKMEILKELREYLLTFKNYFE